MAYEVMFATPSPPSSLSSNPPRGRRPPQCFCHCRALPRDSLRCALPKFPRRRARARAPKIPYRIMPLLLLHSAPHLHPLHLHRASPRIRLRRPFASGCATAASSHLPCSGATTSTHHPTSIHPQQQAFRSTATSSRQCAAPPSMPQGTC
jgi:hypothetical protein